MEARNLGRRLRRVESIRFWQGAMELTFDRGTLVLRCAPNERPPEALPHAIWDPRVDVWRAPAHRYLAVRRALREGRYAGCDRVACRRPQPVELMVPELRPYQLDAVRAWELTGGRGVIVLPTGSGKTRVAISAIARAGVAALVLVPVRALLAQWEARLRAATDLPIGVYGDGRHEVEALTVCTFESALRHADVFAERFGMLVVDEVHHFGSGARIEALEMCPAPRRLGLTATPPDAPEQRARLDSLIGPVCYERVAAEMLGTYLAPLERVRVGVELTGDERAAYARCYGPYAEALRAFMRTSPGASWSDFMRAARGGARGRELVAGYWEAVRLVGGATAKLELARSLLGEHRDTRSLVFTADNHAAYRVSRELLIPAITCDIKPAERRDVLERFGNGRVRAIVSARVLNEGLDVPEAQVALLLGGRLGAREHIQRIGRVLRPGPGKRALVYEVIARDTFEEGRHERMERRLCFR